MTHVYNIDKSTEDLTPSFKVALNEKELWRFHDIYPLAGSQIDARKNQSCACHVVYSECFAEEDHGQDDAEDRDQVDKNTCPAGPDRLDTHVPEKIG